MWSDGLVFCDCDFQSVCPLMEKDERLMGAFWWERLTGGKLGLVLMGRAMFSKSLIQFSADGWSCVPSLLLTWGQTMVEVMKIMRPPSKVPCMYGYTQCPQPCSRPPPTHVSARDSWTRPGKSRSVSCGVTAPFSWVLVYTRFCLCPPRVYFPVLCMWERTVSNKRGWEKGISIGRRMKLDYTQTWT